MVEFKKIFGSTIFMAKRLLQMLLFIIASMAIILIIYSPMILFNGDNGNEIRLIFAEQTISPQRLFISSWRNIKSMYFDASLNNQDWDKWKYKYLSKIKTDDDVTVAINTMIASLDDPYSKFFNKKDYTLQETFIRNHLETNPKLIDRLRKDYKSVTVEVETIAGIATKAKVCANSQFFPNPKIGDEIISINGYNINGLEINSAINLIRGTQSYLATVKILRNNEIMTLTLPRGCLSPRKLFGKKLDDNIVQIFIYTFMGKSLPKMVEEEIKHHTDAKGFIIDLRGDAGGQALNGLFIAEKFLEGNKDLIAIKYRNGSIIPIKSENRTIIDPNIPVVILVDKRTASASEILAGILQKNNRAIVVGEETYGKNAMQQIIPLPNNTCLNLTTSYYSFGNNFDKKSSKVTPDFIVKTSSKDIIKGKDMQLEKAISVIKKILNK